MNTSTLGSTRHLVQAFRDELADRRKARAARRALELQLGPFTTSRDVAELLALIKDQDGPEVELVRDLLLDNLRPQIVLNVAG